MTIQLFANNAKTTLAAAITSTQTTITVAPGTGVEFPSPSAGQQFKVTLVSATSASVYEICNCIDRSGDVLTVQRGQEGTSAQPFILNDIVGNFDTAAVMTDLVQSEQLQQNYYGFAVATGTANAITATIPSNLTTLSDGISFVVKSIYANTGAATLNLTLGSTSTGVYPIVKGNNQALVAGDIPAAGYPISLIWSSSFSAYVLQNPVLSVAEAPQFDNSNAIATTSFVQRALGNYQGVTQYTNQTATIPASLAGQLIVCGGSGNTLTLPYTSSVPIGTSFIVFSQGGATTISAGGSDILVVGAGSNTTVTLTGSEYATIICQLSGVWTVASGTPMLPNSGVFAHNLATNGYQKLPSGLIMQWGIHYSDGTTGAVYQNFNFAFPNACLNVSVTGMSESVTATDIFGINTGGYNQYNFLVWGSTNADTAATMRFTWFALGY